MLSLHYLILTSELWLLLFALFKLEKPKHFIITNISIFLLLIVTDSFRFINRGYHPMQEGDLLILVSLTVIIILLLFRNFKILVVTINIMVFANLLRTITTHFILTIFQIETPLINENIWLSLSTAITGLIVIFIMRFIIIKYKINFKLEHVNFKIIFVFLALFSYGFYITLYFHIGNTLSATVGGQIINMIALIAGFGSMLIMFDSVINRNRVLELNAQKQLDQKLSEARELHLKAVETKEKETRKYRHDTKNHLISTYALLKNSDIKAANKYLEKLITDIDAIQNMPGINTGSKIVDMNVDYIRAIHADQNITFELSGSFPDTFTMDRYDATELFSNLLNNAFEAAVKSNTERYVKMYIRELNNYIMITVKNSFNAIDGFNITKTLKTDKDNHGFGVTKMQEIIKKYEGTIEFLTADNEIIIEIMLPKFVNSTH